MEPIDHPLIGQQVESKRVGRKEGFVGIVEAAFSTSLDSWTRVAFHVRDLNTGDLWHRDIGDFVSPKERVGA